MPSEYSKYYMDIIVNILELEYSLPNRLDLLFHFKTCKYSIYKKNLVFGTSLILLSIN